MAAHEPGGVERLRGDHDRVERLRPARERDLPTVGALRHREDLGAVADLILADERDTAVGELLHPALHRHEVGHRPRIGLLRRRLLHRGGHRADERAVALLHLDESREGGTDAHVVGVAGVDSGHQRLGDLVEALASEAARDERLEALVVVVPPRADEQVHPHSHLAGPRY